MKLKAVYDIDGTKELVIKAHRITAQIVPGTSTAMVHVYNKKGKVKKMYHFSKIYTIEKTL